MRVLKNNKGFTLIELMLLILLLVILIICCYPMSEKFLLSKTEELIQDRVSAATDEYIKGYIDPIETKSNCYEISYYDLIAKKYLRKPSDIYCSGTIQLIKNADSETGYEYKYYLSCNTNKEVIMLNANKAPTGCTVIKE